jgi:hypothetical protein
VGWGGGGERLGGAQGGYLGVGGRESGSGISDQGLGAGGFEDQGLGFGLRGSGIDQESGLWDWIGKTGTRRLKAEGPALREKIRWQADNA